MLKPVDLTTLTFLVANRDNPTQIALAVALGISQSNVHRALTQLRASDLLDVDGRPRLQPFRQLLVHAVRYVYPAVLGAPARGVPTAHSAPMLSDMVNTDARFVWPLDIGTSMGTSIVPLHKQVPSTVLVHPAYYELMGLIEIFRVGRVREVQAATQHLDGILNR